MSVFTEKLSGILGGAGGDAGVRVPTFDAAQADAAGGASAGSDAAGSDAAGNESLKSISEGLTVFSGFASIAAGAIKARELKELAKFEAFEADNETIRGLGRKNIIKDQLNDVLAGQSVAFAANGVDLSSPVAQTARRKSVKAGERATGTARNQAIIANQARRARSRALLRAATVARISGFLKAGTDIAKAAAKGGGG